MTSGTEDGVKPEIQKGVRRWIVVLVAALAFFYGLDHALMRAQGLPLGWNMAPRG